jgi:hypothetical protein
MVTTAGSSSEFNFPPDNPTAKVMLVSYFKARQRWHDPTTKAWTCVGADELPDLSIREKWQEVGDAFMAFVVATRTQEREKCGDDKKTTDIMKGLLAPYEMPSASTSGRSPARARISESAHTGAGAREDAFSGANSRARSLVGGALRRSYQSQLAQPTAQQPQAANTENVTPSDSSIAGPLIPALLTPMESAAGTSSGSNSGSSGLVLVNSITEQQAERARSPTKRQRLNSNPSSPVGQQLDTTGDTRVAILESENRRLAEALARQGEVLEDLKMKWAIEQVQTRNIIGKLEQDFQQTINTCDQTAGVNVNSKLNELNTRFEQQVNGVRDEANHATAELERRIQLSAATCRTDLDDMRQEIARLTAAFNSMAETAEDDRTEVADAL